MTMSAYQIARVLQPSGYVMLWGDTFRLCEGAHRRVADVVQCVDLIAWDNLRPGNGYRSRRRGSYLLVLQKPPLRAKATWRDHRIPDSGGRRLIAEIHPHAKPADLIARLIGAVTRPGDLVIDPAAGGFTVMHVAPRCSARSSAATLPMGARHEPRAASRQIYV